MLAAFLSCYDCIVAKKALIETNPYLQDPVRYRRDLIRSVSSSTAIETGAKVESIAKTLPADPKPLPVRLRRRSAR